MLGAAANVGCAGGPKRVERPAPAGPHRFDAQSLWVLSDTDMAGTAYADGKLLQRAGERDQLTSIALGSNPAAKASIAASNSVVGWPGSIERHGAFAYVVEVRGEVPDDVERVDSPYEGLPPGRKLQTFEWSGGRWIRTSTISIGINPRSVDMPPSAQWLVAPTDNEGGALSFVGLEDGRPEGSVAHVPLPAHSYGREGTVGAAHAEVDPSGRYIALNLGCQAIQFVRVVAQGGRVTGVQTVGEPLVVGAWLSMGRWSVDGSHFLVADTGWGPKRLDAATNGPGQLVAIRFDPDGEHAVASRAEVSLSPESFELDPSGTLAVVVNMERTYLPRGLPYSLFGRRDGHSLSLVEFDSSTGDLRTVDGPIWAEGVLPENAVFDRDGDAVAVAVFHERSKQPKEGWVQFWHVDRSGETPRLVPTQYRIPVPRGAHDLIVVP